MTGAQRAVKAAAICLAALIIGSIVSVVLGFFGGFTWLYNSSKIKTNDIKEVVKDYSDYQKLSIEMGATSLVIKNGEELKVEGETDSKINITKEDNTIEIKEKRNKLYFRSKKSSITIYIPEDAFKEISLEMGAGTIDIESLKANKLNLDLGAGKLTVKDSEFSKTYINGGAGKINITDTKLGKLELSAGVGEIDITGDMEDESKIEAGIGAIKVTLTGAKEDYTFDVDKGIGSIKIDGEKVKGIVGDGEKNIDIEGGIGSIEVNFE